MIKIAKISNDLYQIDDNELPIDITELRQVVSSYGGLSDVDVSKKLDELDEKSEISLEKQANTAVVVDMYEVDYPSPPDPMKETQEIAKNLDEKNDFVNQFIFPQAQTEDVVVDLHKNIKKQPTQKFNWRTLKQVQYDPGVEEGWGMWKKNRVQKGNVFKFGDTYYQFITPIRVNQLQVGEIYGASYFAFNSGYDLIRYKGLSYTKDAVGPEVSSVKELLQYFGITSLRVLSDADLYLHWLRPEVREGLDEKQQKEVEQFFQKYPALKELGLEVDIRMWADYYNDRDNIWDEDKDYYYLYEGRFARGSGAEKLTFWVAEEVDVTSGEIISDKESSKKLDWNFLPDHKTPIHRGKSSHKILKKLYRAPDHTLRAKELYTINPQNRPDGHWLTYLLYQGYVDRPQPGVYVLTEKGVQAVEKLQEKEKRLQWLSYGPPQKMEFKRGQRVKIREDSPKDNRTFEDNSDEPEDFTIPTGTLGIVAEDTTEEFDDVSVMFPAYKERLGPVPCAVYKEDLDLIG